MDGSGEDSQQSAALWLHFVKLAAEVREVAGQAEPDKFPPRAQCRHCEELIPRHNYSTSKMWDHLVLSPAKGGHGLSKAVIITFAIKVAPSRSPLFQPSSRKPYVIDEQRDKFFLMALVNGHFPFGVFEEPHMTALLKHLDIAVKPPTRKVMKRLLREESERIRVSTYLLLALNNLYSGR